MRCSRLIVLALAIAPCHSLSAQSPDYRNVGQKPTDKQIQDWNIAIGPAGKELPPGSGTAREGAKIFAAKCAVCHGASAEGTPLGPHLLGGQGTISTLQPVKTIGSYWPFATTVWDYVNRAMPRGAEGSLSPDEVYLLTAYLLYRNNIIGENEVIDANTLPKVQMPNRNGFIPQKLDEIADLRRRGCRLGHCP
jgi:S-disulfanyl-L-cysteine oxidoreductase SoxD